MKMKREHYAKLSEAVNRTLVQNPTMNVEAYRKVGASEKQFRWDCLYCSVIDGRKGNLWICDLYKYLNDDHIDTALRRITGTK